MYGDSKIVHDMATSPKQGIVMSDRLIQELNKTPTAISRNNLIVQMTNSNLSDETS